MERGIIQKNENLINESTITANSKRPGTAAAGGSNRKSPHEHFKAEGVTQNRKKFENVEYDR